MSYLIDWMQMTGRYFTVVMYLLIPFRITGEYLNVDWHLGIYFVFFCV